MESESNNKKIIAIALAVVVILLVAAGFYFSYVSNKDASKLDYKAPVDTVDENGAIQIVQTKHQYKDGTHTYAGEIDLPTPCDLLEATSVKTSTSDTSYELRFTTTNSSEACATVITARPFKVEFKAVEEITTSATLNGKKIRLNIFEVGPDEDLDTYEIFIKG